MNTLLETKNIATHEQIAKQAKIVNDLRLFLDEKSGIIPIMQIANLQKLLEDGEAILLLLDNPNKEAIEESISLNLTEHSMVYTQEIPAAILEYIQMVKKQKNINLLEDLPHDIFKI